MSDRLVLRELLLDLVLPFAEGDMSLIWRLKSCDDKRTNTRQNQKQSWRYLYVAVLHAFILPQVSNSSSDASFVFDIIEASNRSRRIVSADS